MSSKPEVVFLKDYRPPNFWIDEVRLRFDLYEDRAIVTNSMRIRKNSDPAAGPGPLKLDGERIRFLSAAIDGRELAPEEYALDEKSLALVSTPGDSFELTIQSECEPQKNLAFEGLYRSGGIFCTQCEAEGFRRITYFLDRPDVMSKYRVEIEADQTLYPILLSNGNLVAKSSLGKGRHVAIWEDPFKKPCYLFAMVAGNLGQLDGVFKRRSGQNVDLRIFCAKGKEERCRHALESLKKSMKWDEDVFGLEYDLDTFMIVAVDDFNMGAMENKGLNIFNASYVLAQPETATDSDYEGIMAVVGHEYFHNWTGNRVTCRDWFQLSLKEGLTVFRDQQFSGDMGSHATGRIGDVIRLRAVQFAEDAGPMAHPIRPKSFISINNFYTATVYEKGAEVIRMIHTILGPTKFRAGMDKYFELFDGKAVTTEDFVAAMAQASGEDLEQFKIWYDQAGTPLVTAKLSREGADVRVTLSQRSLPSPGQPEKELFDIPIALGFVGPDGRDCPLRLDGEPSSALATTRVVRLREAEQSFVFKRVDQNAVISLLRGFSAPVRLEFEWTDAELAFLMAKDSDPFARWEAAQKLATRELLRLISDATATPQEPALAAFDAVAEEALQSALDLSGSRDPAFLDLMLRLPDEAFIAQLFAVVDPDAIHRARETLRLAIATRNRDRLLATYEALDPRSREGQEPVFAARRALKNRCLDFLCMLGEAKFDALALRQMREAKTMTDELAALSALAQNACPSGAKALEEFYAKWKNEPLVVDKWLSLQATAPSLDALKNVRTLAAGPAFDGSNPNKIYNLFGRFASANLPRFHSVDGAGYRFIADQILDIETRNPQVAARLIVAFAQWRRYDENRQALMKKELSRILAKPGLSSDIFEMATKALA